MTAYLLRLRFSLVYKILKTITSKKMASFVPPAIYKYHLGAFSVAKEFQFQPAIIVLFYKMYNANAALLKSSSPRGCWAYCRESNHASARLLKDAGLCREIKMASFPERVRIFIHSKQ